VLPVSGVALAVREPGGKDELFLVETAAPAMTALLELARRVATISGPADGRHSTGDHAGDHVPDWLDLPATDLVAAGLVIRQSWLGDIVRTDTSCPAPDCRERIDVSFGIGEYIGHHRARRARGVVEAGERGWYELAGTPVRFRIPLVGDVVEAMSGGAPAADTLVARCVRAPALTRQLTRRVDRALSTLAPSLDDFLGGACPACGEQVAMRFDPVSYTLAELRHHFAGIHAETHALASAYGWSEEAILALPRGRRQRYASIIAEERSLA